MGGLTVGETGAAALWSDSGYVTEIAYTRDYLRYQAPVTMAFAAACNGFTPPDYNAPFRYCDLGCGEAVTLLTLAASYPQGQFVGVDLNPAHIENARALAQQAGLTNVTLLTTDFADPALRDHGPFDFIAAHGVYSWVSPEVQRAIHALVGATLAEGGLFYFCHYVRPGAARTETLFHLIQSLMIGMTGPLEIRARAAVAKARALLDSKAPLFAAYPDFASDIEDLESRDPRYLVHEFCNRYFYPRYVAEISGDLAEEALYPVGSTRMDRNDLANLFPEPMTEALDGLTRAEADARASLLAQDSFRWDLYQKQGSGPAAPQRKLADLARFHLDAAVFPYGFPKGVTLWERPASFETPAFLALSEGGREGTRTIGDLISRAAIAAFAPEDLHQTLRDMVASRWFQALARPALMPFSKRDQVLGFCHPLSAALCARDVLLEGGISLPSRRLGAALGLGRFDSIAAWAHHGRNRAEARIYLRAQLDALDPETAAKLKAEQVASPEDFAAAWSKFERTVLPLLIKYEILAPVPAADRG
ncbi:MAG: class I SAM-dependent methyltransferase [Pseudorhodobacter sp.]|nr:class I SAM-dependent methyltransferase [Pseudorhodobacter sp.]